ncbi:MAG: peptidylprolyl isomerase [Caldibacillus debilis]|uniref:peptidylprolyl isomerase n=1 Tax=Caldibacillus debilis TaxID=301148 RepID=UPI000B56B3DF|nr:peptidylprolyl isomerase [Caldibacillus debilis]OUM88910.1 MAG: peptidylprolyl isomerase [Caldibacillus debilis]REJ15118.1 MAG: peptidylprolyl isomerase [Caldibacillus debilis]REJ27760.1 MAG: peptidylprolyl isomerase [Caldibacillus debilis]
MKKKMIFCLVLLFGIIASAACGNKENIVESEAGNITKDEFYKVLKDRYGKATLQELVYKKVLEDKYDVSDKEVEAELKKIKDELGDSFEYAMMQSGYQDEDDLKDAIKFNLLQQKAAFDGVKVTDEELRQQYNMETKTVTARHILVKDEKTAKEVLEKLKGGEKFEDLAKNYSTDTATKDKGGDLGELNPDELERAFAVAAFQLNENQISEPVKTTYGYHIIQATKVETKKDVKSFDEMKDELTEKVKNAKVDSAKMQEKLDQLVKDAGVKINDKDLKDLFTSES